MHEEEIIPTHDSCLFGITHDKTESESRHWVRQYLVNVVLFRIKDLLTSDMTVKLNSNLYVGPVNCFPNFDTVFPEDVS